MQRFLIDSIVFLYRVDYDALKKTLSGGLSMGDGHNIPHSVNHTRRTILTDDERRFLVDTSRIISEVSERVSKNEVSLVTEEAYATFFHCVWLPASRLGIANAYLIELLTLYATHQGVKWHQAGMHHKSSMPFRTWSLNYCDDIARRIISDDRLIKAISPNENLRLLLGAAIAQFGNQHRQKRYEAGLVRGYYPGKASRVLAAEFEGEHWQRRVRASNADRE